MSTAVERRIVILTEGCSDPVSAKTGVSVIRYGTDPIVGILDSHHVGNRAQQVLGVGGDTPFISNLNDAPDANTLIIGIAPSGGKVPPAWRPILHEAIDRGMEIVSGLHDFISDDPEFAAAAQKTGARITDVRKNDERDVTTRKEIRPECLRIHTVGHDCSVGKMVVAVEVARRLKEQGHDAKFIATGQTGIMVEGDGCPLDCVVADFVNGAAEKLVLKNQHHDFLVIEGQGCLSHPRYSAVTLGILHGTMPQALIMCYEAGRTHVRGMENIPLHSLEKLRHVYETMGSLQTPCRVIGVGMNSRNLSSAAAEAERQRIEAELGLPACDVYRDGPDRLVEAVVNMRSELLGSLATTE